VARVDIAGVDNAAPCGRDGQCGSGQCRSGQMPVCHKRSRIKNCINRVYTDAVLGRHESQAHSMGAQTATLNDHLRGDSDDNNDGADEDEAQTTGQTPPQDVAVICTSEPATRASDDCSEVCLIYRKDPRIALVPCGHQCFCESCAETVHQLAWGQMPLCRADITMILRLY